MSLLLKNIVLRKSLIIEIIIAIKRSKKEKKDFIIVDGFWTFFFSDENIYIEKLDDSLEFKNISLKNNLIAKIYFKENLLSISYEEFLIFLLNEILENDILFRSEDIRDTCKLLTCISENLEFLI
jgi:adenylate cyclase